MRLPCPQSTVSSPHDAKPDSPPKPDATPSGPCQGEGERDCTPEADAPFCGPCQGMAKTDSAPEADDAPSPSVHSPAGDVEQPLVPQSTVHLQLPLPEEPRAAVLYDADKLIDKALPDSSDAIRTMAQQRQVQVLRDGIEVKGWSKRTRDDPHDLSSMGCAEILISSIEYRA